MGYVLIAAVALGASGLAFFSGFGLGMLLLPVFALFLPVEAAVAATAVVHGAHNLLKSAVAGRHADWSLVIKFGLPALLAALAGAAALGYVAHLGEWLSYSVGGRTVVITPAQALIGLLILCFALFELLPQLQAVRLDRRYLALGGVLSGFFGGLSGHQGALRSAFLVKAGLTTPAFVGTSAVIGLLVDLARIATYGAIFSPTDPTGPLGPGRWPLLLTAVLAAFAGVLLGQRWIAQVRMRSVQILTGVLLIGIGLTVAVGLV